MLGIASAIAFIDSHSKGFLRAIGLCLMISVIDQIIKIFVPVRHFDIVDIGFDLIEAVIGITLVAVSRVILDRVMRGLALFFYCQKHTRIDKRM